MGAVRVGGIHFGGTDAGAVSAQAPENLLKMGPDAYLASASSS